MTTSFQGAGRAACRQKQRIINNTITTAYASHCKGDEEFWRLRETYVRQRSWSGNPAQGGEPDTPALPVP